MSAMKQHIGRQRGTVGIILMVFVVVLLYSAWGATLLRAQKQAQSGTSSAVVARE